MEKGMEGKSTQKGSLKRPRMVRAGSQSFAEDGPGAVQPKHPDEFLWEGSLSCTGSAR